MCYFCRMVVFASTIASSFALIACFSSLKIVNPSVHCVQLGPCEPLFGHTISLMFSRRKEEAKHRSEDPNQAKYESEKSKRSKQRSVVEAKERIRIVKPK